MKLGVLCSVEWLDILATSGWEKKDEVEPQRLWTVGYLVQKDRRVIKVANTKDDKKEYYGMGKKGRGRASTSMDGRIPRAKGQESNQSSQH